MFNYKVFYKAVKRVEKEEREGETEGDWGSGGTEGG